MAKIRIEGKHKLSGEICISGAKNSAVALIPAAILCDEIVKISNIPNISDIDSLEEILVYLNTKIERTNDTVTIDSSKIENKEESGRFIEIKLFGKRMNTLNLFQILYILDIDNYKKDYKEFSLDFQKIDKYDISENFFNIFKKHFEIELIFDKYEKIESYTVTDYNFGNNNNLLILTPIFNDCLPFDDCELFYN